MKLTNILRKTARVVTNTNKRFRAVELDSTVGYFEGNCYAKPLIRGAVIGGIIGYAAGGDVPSCVAGLMIGLSGDLVQDGIRFLRLGDIFSENKKEYSRLREKYRRGGLVD